VAPQSRAAEIRHPGRSEALRMPPALAAGVTDRARSMADLVAVIDAAEAAPMKRGTYKPRKVA
jgi:hypothetical protein